MLPEVIADIKHLPWKFFLQKNPSLSRLSLEQFVSQGIHENNRAIICSQWSSASWGGQERRPGELP
jgi:hypothetical protein